MIRSPCYDHKAKLDCPNRYVGCHSDCQLWKDYENEKLAEYKDRQLEKITITHAREVQNTNYLKSLQKPKRLRKGRI